jgi:hypothetical protein
LKPRRAGAKGERAPLVRQTAVSYDGSVIVACHEDGSLTRYDRIEGGGSSAGGQQQQRPERGGGSGSAAQLGSSSDDDDDSDEDDEQEDGED